MHMSPVKEKQDPSPGVFSCWLFSSLHVPAAFFLSPLLFFALFFCVWLLLCLVVQTDGDSATACRLLVLTSVLQSHKALLLSDVFLKPVEDEL